MTDSGAGALAERVAAIARAAGREILDVYARGAAEATLKEDASPLTEADLRAHRLIVAALTPLIPGVPVLSEEAARPPWSERSGWTRHWLIDPLDGTREYLARNGEFTVNIALIENHAPVLGVVHVPVSDTTYRGGAGQGAWRQRGTEWPQALEVATRAAEPVRVIGSRSHRGDSLAGFLERLGSHELKSVGSSLKLCLIAEGSADVYPRLGPTSEWDTAAAHAVVNAAGGVVVELSGEPLRYNTRESLLNPFFVAYGDRGRDWLALLR
jgi:3'(2'), 5'-bisphosphate nucleotidase